MTYNEIIWRIFLATIISGIIGYEREYENKPAGMRTHILVGVGAATFAIMERLLIAEIATQLIDSTGSNISIGRLVAQVISGIGFLGAGTIIITRQKVLGLTTAASIWIVACLGIGVGYGFYVLSITSFLIIMSTLTVLKRIITVNSQKKLKIKYQHRLETMDFIAEYFHEMGIKIKDIDFNMEITDFGTVYTNTYTVDISKNIKYTDLLDKLSRHKNIMQVQSVAI